jgi:hypothetical protein
VNKQKFDFFAFFGYNLFITKRQEPLMIKLLSIVIISILSIIGIVVLSFKSEPEVSDRAEVQRMLALNDAPKEGFRLKHQYKKNEQLKPRQLKQLLHDVGFRGEALKVAWATAMKESTGRPRSHNKNSETGDNSYGLFQINMIGSLGPARLKQFDLEDNNELFNPVRNAEIAFFMSDGGKNWSAWNGITDNTRKWLRKYPTS